MNDSNTTDSKHGGDSGSPVVSVVMPAYNHERFVGAAVESVLNQTFDNLELIVVDDGSTDSTGEVVQAFKDERLKYVHQENQDAFNALNRGMSMAAGKFIAILNSDDIYAPDRLECLLAYQKETGAECIFTDVQPIDQHGNTVDDPSYQWNVWHRANRDYYFSHGDLYTGFLHGNFMVTTSNLFFSREVYGKAGGFAELRYLHDYDYIFRILLAFPERVAYLHDRKLLNYRIHGGNTLGQGAVIAREQDQAVIRKYLLEGVPEDQRAKVATGVDRLLELERELAVERARLVSASSVSTGPAFLSKLLSGLRAVKNRIA